MTQMLKIHVGPFERPRRSVGTIVFLRREVPPERVAESTEMGPDGNLVHSEIYVHHEKTIMLNDILKSESEGNCLNKTEATEYCSNHKVLTEYCLNPNTPISGCLNEHKSSDFHGDTNQNGECCLETSESNEGCLNQHEPNADCINKYEPDTDYSNQTKSLPYCLNQNESLLNTWMLYKFWSLKECCGSELETIAELDEEEETGDLDKSISSKLEWMYAESHWALKRRHFHFPDTAFRIPYFESAW